MARPTTTESTCTRDAYSATRNWVNQYGDWRDSAGAQQGSTAWAGASATVTTTGTVTIDITSIVQASGGNWFGNADRVCAVLLKSTSANSCNFTANENATPGNRPKITYNGGSAQDVNVGTFFNTATSSALGAVDPMELAGTGTGLEKRIFLELPPPTATVTSAILTLNCTFCSGSTVITAWQVDAGDVWSSVIVPLFRYPFGASRFAPRGGGRRYAKSNGSFIANVVDEPLGQVISALYLGAPVAVTHLAAADGTLTLSGSASVLIVSGAQAAGNFGITGAAGGSVVYRGTGNGPLTLTGAVLGALTFQGAAAANFSLQSTAAGVIRHGAAGAGNLALQGTASTGLVIAAQAEGFLSLTGEASTDGSVIEVTPMVGGDAGRHLRSRRQQDERRRQALLDVVSPPKPKSTFPETEIGHKPAEIGQAPSLRQGYAAELEAAKGALAQAQALVAAQAAIDKARRQQRDDDDAIALLLLMS